MQAFHSLRRRTCLAALALAPATALLGCDRAQQALQAQQRFRGQNVTGAAEGKDLNLPDSQGAVRKLADFRGKVVMLFFGFTQCPDVCPTALARMAQVRQLLGAQAGRLQVIFVTVDPERDTPEILRAYMNAFDPGFIALRPPSEQALQQIASDYKIYYKRVPSGSSYTMDHSAQALVFDTQGRLRLMLGHGQSAQDYAHDIEQLLAEAQA